MKSQADIYYQAILARDPRFDGKFFVGVKTTGIYCRPICPARPKRENVEFFSNGLAAERAGYRPCMRCRPECAPQSPAWLGKNATVQRALKLLANPEYAENNEDTFAEQLGVSARHLRRLFEEELGKTPKQIFIESRLNFSRQLVVETHLPMTEIALSSGFSSIRRFNDAFKERFRRAPSAFRKSKHEKKDDGCIELSLAYRPPLNWSWLLDFYRSHEIAFVENITSDQYERVFKIDHQVGAVRVRHDSSKSQLILKVSTSEPRFLHRVALNIRQMFDLNSDPLFVENHLSQCAFMSQLSRQHVGLRLPRGWDPFEISICTILGQLVSREHACRLTRQLVELYGEKVKNPFGNRESRIFPTAKFLAANSLSELKTTGARKATLREFSRLLASDKISLSSAQDPKKFREQLLAIKGIGPWTAEYISMRAIGDVDAFPETDLILKRVLKQNPKIKPEIFSPWRAYAAIYLWKEFA